MDLHLVSYVLDLIEQLGAYEGEQGKHLEPEVFWPKLVDPQGAHPY